MKPFTVLRPVTLSVLLSLAPAGFAFAQTADPSATAATELATPALKSAASPSPSPTATPEPSPEKKKRTPEEKKARKEARLRKYDTNKDGKLDKKEKAAMRADMGLTPETDDVKASPKP